MQPFNRTRRGVDIGNAKRQVRLIKWYSQNNRPSNLTLKLDQPSFCDVIAWSERLWISTAHGFSYYGSGLFN
ncbi:MAG: hypothetical protein DWQ37_09955 [Planctomycetota bacterium]|nr:MAG: hypothetical protein DWQ37_09955 [Planctomycetota bacterium]